MAPITEAHTPCSSCHGTGNQINAKHRCKKCSGKKLYKEKKVLNVNVIHGSYNGETIKFIGEANQSVNIFNNLLFFRFLFI